jgi:hypothetical protein
VLKDADGVADVRTLAERVLYFFDSFAGFTIFPA